MSQDRFSVGILFVHGIGTQRKGETLTNFGGGRGAAIPGSFTIIMVGST